MKKPVILSLVVILLVIALAAAYFLFLKPAPAAEAPTAEAPISEAPPQEAAEQSSDQPALSPELLRDGILLPAVSYHPGTAGSTLGSAQAAAKILSFITENRFHTVPEDQANRLTQDAFALLSGEEQGWLRENLPGLIELIDSVFSDYTALSGRFDDAGADTAVRSALENEAASEDWSRLRGALVLLEAADSASS